MSSYYVYRGTSTGGESGTALGTASGSSTSYNDTTASAGTTYYYTVEAANIVGNSAASNEASALTVPAAPTGLAATSISATQINLSWTSPGGTVNEYFIYRSTTPGGEGTTPVCVQGGTTWSDSNRSPGTTYYYDVKAYNASGYSVASSRPAP